ncbi:TorD/DmsD family molecular chaperone [Desulforhopalus singaporensis]|nr:molecular chaperone TorD family protein [Desulforhopalus singaporensis]
MESSREVVCRSNSFKLLGACFYEPDKEIFIEERVCANLASQLRDVCPEAAACAEKMEAELERETQQRLRVDYAALFVGPFALIAPPYGSVYLEQNRRVMGDSTQMVKRYYQDAGLTVEMKEPPDHIAIEFEFMYFLLAKEITARAEDLTGKTTCLRQLQSNFFNSAMPWIPEFTARLQAGAATDYYRELAKCTSNFYDGCCKFYATDTAHGI